jgi:hypothetical protein
LLPYYKKLFSFYEKAAGGWRLITSLEIDGIEILKSSEIALNKSDEVLSIYQTLCTVEKVRTLATLLNLKISFFPESSFTQDEYRALLDALSVAQKTARFTKEEFTAHISAKYLVDKDAKSVKLLQQANGPINLDVVEDEEQVLTIYSQQVVLPKRIFRFSSLTPNLDTIHDATPYTEGELIDIKLSPTEQFELTIEFRI